MTGFHPPIHEPPERVSLTCPLGLRFVDVATGTVVYDGIEATASLVGAPRWQAKIRPVLTPGGVLAFHGLPGLRTFENSNAEDPWLTRHPIREFQIEVTDPLGRFLPCTFPVIAPVKFGENSSPPLIDTGAVPLFPAPSRTVPAGLAVVRAQLRNFATGNAAALALVEAVYSTAGRTRTARGLADDKGAVVLLLAYPEGQRRAFDSSPPGGARGLSQQEWTLDLRFFHEPTFTPAEVPPPALMPEPKFADYSLRLSQPQVHAWRAESPLAPVSEATLQFGNELDLGTLDLDSV